MRCIENLDYDEKIFHFLCQTVCEYIENRPEPCDIILDDFIDKEYLIENVEFLDDIYEVYWYYKEYDYTKNIFEFDKENEILNLIIKNRIYLI